MARLKNSVGIWAFGTNATRFMPQGYHPEYAKETSEERAKRASEGLGIWADGFEFHYPGEIDERSHRKIESILHDNGHDIYAIALGAHSIPRFANGSFVNPRKELRKEAVEMAKRAADLASVLGARFIIWPGNEGYNYPNQADYEKIWNDFINGVGEVVQHAHDKDVTVFLEDKNSEPKMRILMRDQGMSIFMVNELKERGYDVSRVKINMDWQHLLMRGENLPEYARLLHMKGLLGHQHANSGWGTFDDDNIVGASFIEQTLGLAIELRLCNYGADGERIGFDLFPYTEDQVEAVKQSILNWDCLDGFAEKLTSPTGPYRKRLLKARREMDAVTVTKIIYDAVFGLNESYVNRLREERTAEREAEK